MTGAVLRVQFAGPHVTVQDGGRPGLMRFGVPASGPMDRKSFAIANAALGNPPEQVGIEVSRGGLTLNCVSGAVTFALAGGGFIAELGGRKLGSWQIATLRADETLTLRPGPWGSWTYLAFAGTLEAPEWLGSRATHGLSGFGGGRLGAGQTLTVPDAAERRAREGAIPCPVWARPRRELRCVPGPQDRFFSPETMADLTGSGYVVTDAADRMGARLRGPSLMPEGALSIPSEPILRGSIQVAGDGVPTILLSDHQTTGGYPKIATVLADDVDGFVQCRPRDVVAFKPISPAEAVALTRTRALQFRTFLSTLTR